MAVDIGFGCRRPASYPFLGEDVSTQDGTAWKHSREMLGRHFTRLQAKDLTTVTEQLEDLISTFRNSTGVVDLQAASFHLTLASTKPLLFGVTIEALSDGEQQHFAGHFDHASQPLLYGSRY